MGIVQDQDAGVVIDALVQHEFGSTRINTVGGFLKRGNATILVGVEDDQVDHVITLIRENTRGSDGDPNRWAGAVFVLPVNRFVQM